MNRSLFLFSIFVAGAASAQVQVPVQGFVTDSGVAVSGSQTLEFRLVDDQATDLSCESQALTLDAGYFTALLGGPGATDCGGAEPTDLDPALFAQPLSLEVSIAGGAVLGLFPVGDAPSAGFARLADRVVDELPNIVRAPDSPALLAALAAAGGNPTVIELGAGGYGLPGGTVVPALTDLRGLGASTTTLVTDALILEGNNRISGIGIRNTAPNGVAIIPRPGPNELIELIDISVVHTPASDGAFGIVIDQNANETSRLVLRDSELLLQGPGASIAIVDQRGVRLEIDNTRITTSSDGLSVGLRVGVPGTNAPTTDTRISRSRIEVASTGGFAAGIEPFLDAGLMRVVGTEIRSVGTNGRAISANGGDIRVLSSLLFADVPLFALSPDSLKVSGSGIESFVGTVVDPSSFAVQCIGNYNEATFTPIACN